MASSAYYKFDAFSGDLGLVLHNLNTDTLKVYLTNEQPVVGDTLYNSSADENDGYGPMEITAASGYTAGGEDVVNTYSQTAGVATLASAANTTGYVKWTAGASIGPFRYAVLYNSSATAKNLICWFDYGAALTLGIGESLTLEFTSGDIFTLQKSA